MPSFLDIHDNKQIQFAKSRDLGHNLYTLTPKPLAEIELSIENELLPLLITAHQKLGELKGMLECIDDKSFIIKLFQVDEAISSCGIDNIEVDLLDLFIGNKQVDTFAISKVNKYRNAMHFTKAKNITLKAICNLHATVMAEDETEYWINRQPDFLGRVRTIQTQLLLDNRLSVINVLQYNPTPPEHLEKLFDEMLEYYNKNSEHDILIKSAMMHYQFESLHPFLGGNGRIGRLLIHKTLVNSDLLNHSILPFSEYLVQNKWEYFDRLWSAQYSQNLIPWIKYFLTGMINSSELTIRRISTYAEIRKRNLDAIANCGSHERNLMLIYKYLETNLVIDIRTVAEVLSVSFNTASKIVHMLIELDILRPLDSKKRYKVYVYSMISAILN